MKHKPRTSWTEENIKDCIERSELLIYSGGSTALSEAQKSNLKKKEQPCWRCKKATGGCEWSARLEPVPGWTAKAITTSCCGEIRHGYAIKACPKFEKDERE